MYYQLRTLGRKGSTVKSQRLFAIRHYLHKKAKRKKSVYFQEMWGTQESFFWKVGKQNNISHKNFASTYFSICGLFCAIKEQFLGSYFVWLLSRLQQGKSSFFSSTKSVLFSAFFSAQKKSAQTLPKLTKQKTLMCIYEQHSVKKSCSQTRLLLPILQLILHNNAS